MEQITREEMIELLSSLVLFADENDFPSIMVRAKAAIAALQAAEPAMVVDIRRDPRDGSPSPRILKFADLGDGEHQLFALPCPPATELAPESWREELETIAEILETDGDEWNCAARIRKILKTSPAPNNDKDGCTCQGCGIVYAADLIVPDDWWEKIKPEGKAEGSGLLCPTCIMGRLVEKGWSAGHIASPAPNG